MKHFQKEVGNRPPTPFSDTIQKLTLDDKLDDLVEILPDPVGHLAEVTPTLLGRGLHEDERAIGGPVPLPRGRDLYDHGRGRGGG